MHYVTAVLRRAAAERGMTGGEAARDAAIELFLDELGGLFTEALIQSLSDKLLADLYEDWLRSLGQLSAEQRRAALIDDLRLSPVPFLVYRKRRHPPAAAEAPAPNVVPLHTR